MADLVEERAMTATPIYGRTAVVLSSMLLLGVTSCGGPEAIEGAVATPTTVTATEALTSPSPTGVAPLPDGVVEPGRYRFVVSVDCEGVEDDPIACPEGLADPPPIPVDVTVPDGWEHLPGFPVIRTIGEQEQEVGALVLGWTSNTVGVQSDPCSTTSHALPDVDVGPSVDDFVDTVTSQEWFRGTTPVDTKVGDASGRYFTLKGPADLSRCEEWRPWDPGFYAQGPNNLWEVWVLDVGGHRVLIVANYFPGTSARTIAQLSQRVTSFRFTSS
jgi:hypothetical protein